MGHMYKRGLAYEFKGIQLRGKNEHWEYNLGEYMKLGNTNEENYMNLTTSIKGEHTFLCEE